ncbi:kinase-like protein [Neolentinus lepideus HHB14362 ss-1]|uniref:Kinase-like protein n=1 Tax=Neolentinus lepideus HHB14362 ss-1 TaxID=1314782 RepID=A0A165UAH3_9AGAM|nr:kinase-like protein [Neolentinus lepideus HHB14362 ss-1]
MYTDPNVLELPPVRSSFMERFRGYIHRTVLVKLSRWYCRWFNYRADMGIFPLPFNLVLKYTHRTRRAEALAMSMARKLGIPTPRLISYGSDGPHWKRGSILMTRMPGKPLDEVHKSLLTAEWDIIREQLASYLLLMRSCKSPWCSRVCSVEGRSLIGARIPGGEEGPWADEAAFHATFLGYASPLNCNPEVSFEDQLATVKLLTDAHHNLVFTHGDLLSHNILIDKGRVSAVLDWEYAGLLPEYWEYTQILRLPFLGWWWPQFAMTLPGYKYEKEYKSYCAMWSFARDSFSW